MKELLKILGYIYSKTVKVDLGKYKKYNNEIQNTWQDRF